MALTVVLDIGKSAVKLVAFAPDLRVAWRRAMPNAPRREGAYDALDTEAHWAFLLDGLAAIAREGRIADIAVTTHGCAIAALGDDDPGTDGLALPVMDYEWPGVRGHDATYDALRPPFAETGAPALPLGLNTARQLHWQMRERPADWARVRALLPLPQYLAWRLSGVMAADVSSLGCHSDLWAPAEGAPSSLARALGLERLLAPVRPADAVLGPMRAGLAARLGLAAPPAIRTGLHDSNASLAPFLGAGEPFAFVASGTWAIAFAVGARPGRLDEARDCLLNVDARGRPVPSARAMLGREFELLAGDAPPASPSPSPSPSPSTSLEDAVAVIEAGARLTPAFVPGVGPFPRARGAGADHPALADPRRRRAAISLYAALVLDTMLGLLDAKGAVILDGPLAADPLVPAALAVLTGRPVRLGGADAAEGLARLVTGAGQPPTRTVTPPPDLAARLPAYAAAWRAALA